MYGFEIHHIHIIISAKRLVLISTMKAITYWHHCVLTFENCAVIAVKHEVQTGLELNYKLRPDPSPYSWIIISTMMWENVCENTSEILKFCWCLFLCCFRMTWAEALSTVQSYQTHLEQMSSESLIGLRLAEDPHIQSYHKKIDSCMGNSSKVGTWRIVIQPCHPASVIHLCIWADIGYWKPQCYFDSAFRPEILVLEILALRQTTIPFCITQPK